MTIWIDPPRWPAHGRLWSHLISDTSLDELHDFAAEIGIPRGAFEGDHYDLPEEHYATAVAAGARETTGTDLVRRLIESGLRMSKRKGDKGIERFRNVPFPDGTTADLDLFTSSAEMPHDRIFASTVLIQDASHRHLVTWSERRQEWSPCGGWREGDELPVTTAVRETAEEAGLALDPTQLRPIGYERFRPDPEIGPGLWVPGKDIIQVYATRTTADRPPLRGETPGGPQPEWLTDEEFAQRCQGSFWWPLVAAVLRIGSGPPDAAPGRASRRPRRPAGPARSRE